MSKTRRRVRVLMTEADLRHSRRKTERRMERSSFVPTRGKRDAETESSLPDEPDYDDVRRLVCGLRFQGLEGSALYATVQENEA